MAIFGATAPKKARVFQAGSAKATIGDTPAILLGVNVQVNRQLSPIPTLTDGVVWSAQPVQGTLSAQSILVAGESKGLLTMLTESDLCRSLPCSVSMDAGSCDSEGIRLEIADGYCSAVSFTASGGQGYIGNDFTIQFTTCTVK